MSEGENYGAFFSTTKVATPPEMTLKIMASRHISSLLHHENIDKNKLPDRSGNFFFASPECTVAIGRPLRRLASRAVKLVGDLTDRSSRVGRHCETRSNVSQRLARALPLGLIRFQASDLCLC